MRSPVFACLDPATFCRSVILPGMAASCLHCHLSPTTFYLACCVYLYSVLIFSTPDFGFAIRQQFIAVAHAFTLTTAPRFVQHNLNRFLPSPLHTAANHGAQKEYAPAPNEDQLFPSYEILACKTHNYESHGVDTLQEEQAVQD